MEEPLPLGWRVVWSESYQTQYWFHADRRESSWLRPYVDPSGREAFAEQVDGNGPGTQEVPSPEPSPLSDGGGGFGGAQSPKYSPRVGGASSDRVRGFDYHGGVDGGDGGGGGYSDRQPDEAALAMELARARDEEAHLLVALGDLKQQLRATVRERERLARALAAAQQRAMGSAQGNEHGYQVIHLYI